MHTLYILVSLFFWNLPLPIEPAVMANHNDSYNTSRTHNILPESLLITIVDQKNRFPISSIGAQRYEKVDVGGLHHIGIRYKFSLNSDQFQLDTVFVKSDDIAGYEIRPGFFVKNQINATEFEYILDVIVVKKHLGNDMFSESLNFKGVIFIEGESLENFSVVHQLTETPEISTLFLVFQYFWVIHNWLLVASILVLLISKEPLNLRHGLIVVIPLFGPGVYLTKEMIRFYQARKKKESKRISQSTQHQQNASY